MFLFHFTQKFFEYNHKTDFIKEMNHRYIKLIEKVTNKIIREKTGVNDILEAITKTRWKWAGHVARMNDNRWTVRCTEWQVRSGKRSRGRPRRRWRDDLQQWQGAVWSRTAKDRLQWRCLAEGYLQQWREIP